jgi:hypothetical protein
MLAAEHGRVGAIEILIGYGADIHDKTQVRLSYSSVACEGVIKDELLLLI